MYHLVDFMAERPVQFMDSIYEFDSDSQCSYRKPALDLQMNEFIIIHIQHYQKLPSNRRCRRDPVPNAKMEISSLTELPRDCETVKIRTLHG